MLKSIDLFTGIGGQVRALHGIAEPVAYVEKAPDRRRILARLVEKSLIPRAPLHEDVREYTCDAAEEVDIVVASWPCKGFSIAGFHDGFEHEETGLFREFVRIVKDARPKLVFQENVSRVASTDGLDEIVAELGGDYDLSWTVVSACNVGASHIRKRWFCLGIRKDVPDESIVLRNPNDLYRWHDWSREPCPRMTTERVPLLNKRCEALGNAVVPDAARTAFLLLCSGFSTPFDRIRDLSTLAVRRPEINAMRDFPASGPQRYDGCSRDGKMYRVARAVSSFPTVEPKNVDLHLVLDPEAYRYREESKAPPENVVVDQVPFSMWATPRGGGLNPQNVLTRRGTKDLSTQLRFERGTPDSVRSGRPNPEFLEHLMGFSPGWTEVG